MENLSLSWICLRRTKGALEELSHDELQAQIAHEMSHLLNGLGKINHQAQHSLLEANEETMTVIRLTAPQKLRKTLLSTNAIESIFASVRSASLRITNWTGGKNQMVRWTVALLLEVENHLKRIPGYKDIPYFLAQLKYSPLTHQKNVA